MRSKTVRTGCWNALILWGGMNGLTTVLAASVTSFAATNIDDLFLLTLFFARRIPARRIVAGQYLGLAGLVLVSGLGALLTFAIPAHWIRLLGLLPLALGIKELWEIRQGQRTGEAIEGKQGILSIAMITVSNGGDNVGVYVPLFRWYRGQVWLILIVYALLVAIWCMAARSLGRHPLVLRTFDRAGHWLVPFVFIGLGVYILAF